MNDTITLDSNVFRNQMFIDWLTSSQAPHKLHIFPLIAYIEVLVWYEMRGLARNDLDDDLKKMKTVTVAFSIDYIDYLMKNIRSTPSLLFRHHARDFLIGTIAQEKNSLIITNNKRHFEWISTEQIFSPEEYLLENVTRINQTSANGN